MDIIHILISQKMANNLLGIKNNKLDHHLHNHQGIFHKNWHLQKLFQRMSFIKSILELLIQILDQILKNQKEVRTQRNDFLFK